MGEYPSVMANATTLYRLPGFSTFHTIRGTPASLSYPIASALLILCISSTTFTTYHSLLRYVRLLVAFPLCALWYAAAYPSNISQDLYLGAYSTIASLGLYGLMKTLDVCVIGFWDTEQDMPRWVLVKSVDKKRDEGGANAGEVELIKVAQPLPSNFLGRFAYGIDAFFSVRGASFFKDCAWNWASKEIWTFRPPADYASFIKSRIQLLTQELIILDIMDTILATHKWDTMAFHPLTNLAFPLQILYTAPVGFLLFGCGFMPFTFISLVLVPLTGMHPSSWAPWWGPPLETFSIADFWARRWHSLFRRVFTRLSLPIEWAFQPWIKESKLKYVRATMVFAISTLFHLMAPMGIPLDGKHRIVFWECATIKFFMSQPLGLLLEAVVVLPATERLPGKWKTGARRVFTWSWILWTGRWYCDGYMVYGQFDKRALPYSPITQLLKRLGVPFPA